MNKKVMNIIYITPYFQHPDVPGSHRHYHFIKELSKRHQITLITPIQDKIPKHSIEEMELYTGQIFTFGFNSKGNDNIQFLRNLVIINNLLRIIRQKRMVLKIKGKLNELIHAGRYDVILFHGKILYSVMNKCNLPLVVDFCDATSMRLLNQMHQDKFHIKPIRLLKYLMIKRIERKMLKIASQIAFISKRDRDAVSGPNERNHIVPNGVNLEYWSPKKRKYEKNNIVFTGVMSYKPNENAALYLIKKILPRIRLKVKGVHLYVVGKAPSKYLKNIAGLYNDITVTGFVEDVRPYLQKGTVFAAPIQFASGMQNKVLEAMAMKLPVVTTPVVAAGISAEDEQSPVLIGGDEDRFTNLLLELLHNPEECGRLGDKGRKYVERHFNWRQSADKFEKLCFDAINSSSKE